MHPWQEEEQSGKVEFRRKEEVQVLLFWSLRCPSHTDTLPSMLAWGYLGPDGGTATAEEQARSGQ